MNADGLSQGTFLRLEILDESLKELPGYSGQRSAVVESDGLRAPATWPSGRIVKDPGKPVRIRVSSEGLRPEDIRLYALYAVDSD